MDIDKLFVIKKDVIDIKKFYNSNFFNSYNLTNYVFRGQGDKEYTLLPSAFRKTEDNKKLWSYNYSSNWEFIITEIRNIMLFYRICNKNGLFLPQIPNWLLDNSNCNFINMKIFKEKYLSKNKNWIDDNLKELFALAQHYGMPTRLLDWTYQFNTALYFGAMDSLEKTKKDFSVWGLNVSLLEDFKNFLLTSKIEEYFGAMDSLEKTKKDFSIQGLNVSLLEDLKKFLLTSKIEEISSMAFPLTFIVPKYHDNININAQKGVLSLWEVNISEIYEQTLQDEHLQKLDDAPLERLLRRFIENHSDLYDEFIKKCPLYKRQAILVKFNFKYNECRDILINLKSQGIDYSHIYPGYRSVITQIKKEKILDIF